MGDRTGVVQRRAVLLGIAGLAVSLSLPGGAARAARTPARTLGFRHLHTGETLSVCYWEDGRYLADALAAIDHVLRDHRTGEAKPIDRALLDLLVALRARLGSARPFEVISGYRSPKTNAALRRRSTGVAKRSLHMAGQAIDVRLPDCRLADLRAAAVGLRRGGVGYYPDADFVHVDTGRVRQW